MRSARTVIAAVVCVFISTNLFAFDGQRTGFILGGGVGAGYLSNKTSFGPFSNTESETVFLTNFKIGYAPSNILEIYYVSKVAWWGEQDITLLLGISAVGFTTYFDKTSETGFFVFGILGGLGYEFSRHWSIEGNLLYSKIEESGADLDSFGVRVTVNVLAF